MINMKNTKLLIAPAHRLITNKYGSEYSWSYKLIENIYSDNIDIYAIFNYKNTKERNDIKNVNIITFKELELDNLINGKLKISGLYDTLIFMFRYFFMTRKLIKRNKFDIIHHMLPFAYGMTFSLLPIFGYTNKIPFIIGPLQSPLEFEDMRESVFMKLINPLIFFLSKKTLDSADTLICIDEDTKRLYSKILKRDKIIKVIPPGIDVNKFNYVVRKRNDIVNIICVSYLRKRKGIDTIIRTLPELIKERPNIHLTIIGSGPEKEYLEELTDNLNIKNYISFDGFVPNTEVVNYYQSADIFVTMSYFESFGQTSIEAMATGLSVIGTKTGVLKDIIVHGDTGFLINHDIKELKECLIVLIDNYELRIDIGKKARKLIEDTYNWKIIGAKYHEIYKQFIR